MEGSSSWMWSRHCCNPRLRVARSAAIQSVKVSKRDDCTGAAPAPAGDVANCKMPAAAPAAAVDLMKSRREYFMARGGNIMTLARAGKGRFRGRAFRGRGDKSAKASGLPPALTHGLSFSVALSRPGSGRPELQGPPTGMRGAPEKAKKPA